MGLVVPTGVTEAEAGGGLTVDHFVPVSAGGDESDDNLVYACFRCNLFKADFHPAAQDRANGHIILHPLRDDVSRHVRLDEATGHVKPLTEIGRFHIAILRLNRAPLVALRLRRRFYELLVDRKRLLDAENSELRAILKAQAKYIARLKGWIQEG